MNKMIIYFYILIPPLFLSVDSSSIRGRNTKNELVPLIGSEPPEEGENLKIIRNEPIAAQLQVPKESSVKELMETDKKAKGSMKKRMLKFKPLRKKHRARRDLQNSRSKILRDEKFKLLETPYLAGNATEQSLQNTTKNAINRVDILKALPLYSKRKETGRKEQFQDERNSTRKAQQTSHNPQAGFTKMVYPSTPKYDPHSHKYTYKDLVDDRKRLEQKIKYIKNMLNDSIADDSVRIRRSESDRTANKIAKMFLTLSAVNSKRKPRCRGNDEDEDRVQDVWVKQRRNNPSKKSSSSNEERYKVKKWIEFLKNKRSSGKTCPCMSNVHEDESDASFPLEQKLPKGYFVLEKSRSSEESSESFRNPNYNSRSKPSLRRLTKNQEPNNKLKDQARNANKKLELPLTDLELYRAKAKQILQNAEEILDRIKEEEERRLSSPNILLNQMKELTSRIHGDPRNNENDLIRKIQKNLGWNALSQSKEGSDGNSFADNVKSFILDPYEKAKALTDESAKQLTSYLLRNLGKIQERSKEQELKESDDGTDNSRVYFGQIPRKEEETPLSASLAKESPQEDPLSKNKEELRHWEETLSTILSSPEEVVQKEAELAKKQEDIKNRMKDIIKEQQNKLNDYEITHNSEEESKEVDDAAEQTAEEKGKEREQYVKAGTNALGESKNLDFSSGEEKSGASLQEKPEKIKIPAEADTQTDKEVNENLKLSEEPKPNLSEEEKAQPLQEKTERLNFDGTNIQKNIKNDEVAEKAPKNLTEKIEVPEAEEALQKETDDTAGVKTEEEKKLEKEIFDEIMKTINENEDDGDLTEEKVKDPKVETSQAVAEESEEQENSHEKVGESSLVQKPETTVDGESTEKEDQDVPEIVSSPFYLKDLPNFENEESLLKPDQNLEETLKDAFEEELTEPRSKDTLLEKLEELETELQAEVEDSERNLMAENLQEALDPSKENAVNLENSTESAVMYNQDKNIESNIKEAEAEKASEEPLKDGDLVKGTNQGSKESSEVNYNVEEDTILEKAESNEEPEVENERTVQESEEDVVETGEDNAEDKPFLKASLNEEEKTDNLESEVVEKSNSAENNQEEENGPDTLEAVFEKNSNEQLDEKATSDNQQSSERETEDDPTMQSENFDIKKKETSESDETPEGEDLVNKTQETNPEKDVDGLTAKMSAEKTDSSIKQGSTEDSNDETILKEGDPEDENESPIKQDLSSQKSEEKTENSAENAESIEEPSPKEASLEENDDEVQESHHLKEEDNDETPLQATFTEDHDLDDVTVQDPTAEAANPNQDVSQSSEEESRDETLNPNSENGNQDLYEGAEVETPKDGFDQKTQNSYELSEDNLNENEEKESIKSTNNDDDHTVQANANEDERSKSETDEEVELRESDHEDLNKDDETLLKSENSEENFEQQKEDSESEVKENLRAENFEEEGSQEIPLKSTQKDSREETDYNPQLKENSGEENQTSENSDEKTDDSSESLREVFGNLSEENTNADEMPLKEVNPGGNNEQEKQNTEDIEEEPRDETPTAASNNKNQDLDKKIEEETPKEVGVEDSDPRENDEPELKATFENPEEVSAERTNEKENYSQETNSGEVLEKKQENLDQLNEEPEQTAEQENQNRESSEETLEEAFEKEAKSKEGMESDETSVGAVLDAEGEKNLSNEKSEENESTQAGEEGDESSVRASPKVLDPENQDEVDVKPGQLALPVKGDPENVGDENPLSSAEAENEFDNKINDETYLKSAELMEDAESSREVSEETLSPQDDLNNQIDGNEGETPLKSVLYEDINGEESKERSEDNSYETVRQENPVGENLIAGDEEEFGEKTNSQEGQSHDSLTDLIKMSEPTSQTLKAGKLQVPKSIGQIMRDLEGKEKDDITSIQNLNPDKIDRIIGKIGEAEQQNLLESQEVDCRKECACADEIDTKSRNIGRYEIVKDFLHWMKDLQLNRVLNDD